MARAARIASASRAAGGDSATVPPVDPLAQRGPSTQRGNDGFVAVLPNRGAPPTQLRPPPHSGGVSSWLVFGVLLALALYFRRPLGACFGVLARLPAAFSSLVDATRGRLEAAEEELQDLRPTPREDLRPAGRASAGGGSTAASVRRSLGGFTASKTPTCSSQCPASSPVSAAAKAVALAKAASAARGPPSPHGGRAAMLDLGWSDSPAGAATTPATCGRPPPRTSTPACSASLESGGSVAAAAAAAAVAAGDSDGSGWGAGADDGWADDGDGWGSNASDDNDGWGDAATTRRDGSSRTSWAV